MSISANRNVTYPFLTADDTYVFEKHAQTLTNKTIPGTALYTYYIYKNEAGNYLAANRFGNTVYGPSSTPDSIFASVFAAFVEYESVFIANGFYSFSPSFPGLVYGGEYKSVVCGPHAVLAAPNGFTGMILKVQPTATLFATNLHWYGGQFAEQGSAQRLWTGIWLNVPGSATEDGIGEFHMHDTQIRNPSIGVELDIDRTDGWINACIFEGVHVRNWTTAAVKFDMTLTPSPLGDSKGFNRNVFSNCVFQADPAVSGQEGAVWNVKHQRNAFVNCQCWDVPDGKFEIDITDEADSTLILGGRMTHKTWRNQSPSTVIIDSDKMIRSPFSKESRAWGEIDTAETTGGLGLLKSLVQTGSPTVVVNTKNTGRRFPTGGTINTTVGFRTNGNPFRSTHFPAFRGVLHFSETSSTRIFIGFTTLGSLVSTDTSLGSTYSVGFMWRPSDSNWQLVFNDNQASATFIDTTVAGSKSLTLQGLELWFLSNQRIRYRINTTELEGSDKQRGHTISDLGGQNLAFQLAWTNTEAVDKRVAINDCKVYDGVIF